jgi:bleomycin hydrolase
MTDDWFEQFTYQVVIHKKYLSEEQLAEYEKDPAVLDPWDPMGSLAD